MTTSELAYGRPLNAPTERSRPERSGSIGGGCLVPNVVARRRVAGGGAVSATLKAARRYPMELSVGSFNLNTDVVAAPHVQEPPVRRSRSSRATCSRSGCVARSWPASGGSAGSRAPWGGRARPRARRTTSSSTRSGSAPTLRVSRRALGFTGARRAEATLPTTIRPTSACL
jgi:hypothetical protein